MCPSSLQRIIFWRQLHPVCPVNCCELTMYRQYWNMAFKLQNGEELNKSNILSSEKNEDYIKDILINNPGLLRKHKALIPLSLD